MINTITSISYQLLETLANYLDIRGNVKSKHRRGDSRAANRDKERNDHESRSIVQCSVVVNKKFVVSEFLFIDL